MASEIEWQESAEQEIDAEIAYVLDEFGFAAARKHTCICRSALAIWQIFR